MRRFLELYNQSNCILRKRTIFSRPKMFPSTNGRRVCCKDSGCGKIYSKSWSEPWWSQKGGNNLPHAKASTHCWTTWNVQASTAYMYWVLIYIKSTRLLTWYDGLHEYHLNWGYIPHKITFPYTHLNIPNLRVKKLWQYTNNSKTHIFSFVKLLMDS